MKAVKVVIVIALLSLNQNNLNQFNNNIVFVRKMVSKSMKKCSVCTDKEVDHNEIFTCSGCNVAVHRLCYGIQNDYDENWKCSLCKKGIRQKVLCKLCCQTEGAFKPVVGGSQYVHVVCGLFTDGVVFEDADLMEPINISKVSNSKRNKMCSFCMKYLGYCCLCSNHKCKNRLHITCAQKANCLKEQSKNDESIKFRAFCIEHKPAVTDRKISSGSVRRVSMMIAKKKDEENKENSSRMNAQWILDRIDVQDPVTNGNISTNVVDNVSKKSNEKSSVVVGESSKLEKSKKTPSVHSKSNEKSSGVVNKLSNQENSKGKRNSTSQEDHTPKRRKSNENRSAEEISENLLIDFSPLHDIKGKFINHSCMKLKISIYIFVYYMV